MNTRWDALLAYLQRTAVAYRPDYFFSLYYLASHCPPHSTIVEIGCHKGDSTLCLALAADETDSHVVTIDPVFVTGEVHVEDEYSRKGHTYTSDFTGLSSRLLYWGLIHRVSVVPAYSADVLQLWGTRPIHLLIVDGEHTMKAVREDCWWLLKIPKGGRAAFDDWFAEIEQTVKEFLATAPGWQMMHESTQGHWPNGFNLTYLERA